MTPWTPKTKIPKAPATVLMMLAASTLATAQGLVQMADSPIEGQYIVIVDQDAILPSFPMLEKGVTMRRTVDAIARERRIDIRNAFDHAVHGFVARMSYSEAEALAAEPWVTLVEQDGIVEVTGTQAPPPSWGLDRIDQRSALLDGSYSYNSGGVGVDGYVVDSGIRSTHTDFGGRVDTVNAFTAVNDGKGTEDCFGHGTMVAGIIGSATYGVAKGVTLHPVRVVDCTGKATISGVVAAVDWITAQYKRTAASPATRRPAVANISLITPGSLAIDAAVKNSILAGIAYVVAAGNSAKDSCYYSPARVPGALTVGAANDADNVWISSNGGSCVDLFAPGVQVNTLLSRTDTDTTATTGTSASAPHVAGAAALYLATAPQATPAAVGDAILAMATPDALAAMPTGSPNRLLYSASIGANKPPVTKFTATCARQRCSFNASASSDDNGIASFAWSFGDGTVGAGMTAAHRYARARGMSMVTLTVTDTNGVSSRLVKKVSY